MKYLINYLKRSKVLVSNFWRCFLQKPTSIKSQALRTEDPEIERRKAVQREKAEILQAKKASRQDMLDEDRRKKNSLFLDRLEGKR